MPSEGKIYDIETLTNTINMLIEAHTKERIEKLENAIPQILTELANQRELIKAPEKVMPSPKDELIDIMNLLNMRIDAGNYEIIEVHEYNQYKLKITLEMEVG